ncbi:hypothetical protein ALQ60_200264 [Pseudomonas syringae pv. papulans]|nr:hypothetical protein ALO65_200191 [Pseudomonas syringae pv. papulans]KWS37254.1 hypothetical protein AL059_00090 [Pseudomonas syringae pv. papulans]NAT15426.1 hypothetical protein [Pseudomonas syringae pv. actinidifoliorum]NAT57750.1 hypothetical protein [Pseudomonas syringae pv. actinidifoliorum]RMN38337.1 hypothetical protein ALQ60_200264 [Pseudomonas syringae pv. papulans]
MPIDDQLMLQMAYEMPRQRLADLQATFELMEATEALRGKGLSKRCKAINADNRPVNTDRIVQPRTTLVGAHNRSKDSRKIIPIGFAGKRPELTIRQ